MKKGKGLADALSVMPLAETTEALVRTSACTAASTLRFLALRLISRGVSSSIIQALHCELFPSELAESYLDQSSQR